MAEVVSIGDYLPARPFAGARAGTKPMVVFDRHELDLILQVYGRKVVAGEWRDYALDFDAECASFEAVRSADEGPAVRILKRDGRQPGAPYLVVSQGGRVLRRGGDLAEVLRLFEAGPRLL